ncbi:MAG: hypothetical protein IJ505_01180 [Succinivibrio sp.]|nr:hypothetical protein [Succinivibrio sp.]
MPKITYSATTFLDNVKNEYFDNILNPSFEELGLSQEENQVAKDQADSSSEDIKDNTLENFSLLSIFENAAKLMFSKTKIIEDHFDMTKNSGTFGTLNSLYYIYGASNNIFFENKKVYTHISKMKILDVVEAADFIYKHIDVLTKILHFSKNLADIYMDNDFLNPGSIIIRFSHPRNSIEAFLTPEIIPKDQSKCMRFFISNDQYAEYIGLGTLSASDDIHSQSHKFIKQMRLAEDLMFFINTLRYIIEKPERLVEGTPEGYKNFSHGYILKYIR